MKFKTRRTKLLVTLATVQLLGTACVLGGAGWSMALQLAGWLMLFPGSFVAEFVPLDRLWTPLLGRMAEMDPAALSTLLYLPCAVVLNVAAYWIAHRLIAWRLHNFGEDAGYTELKVGKSEA